MLPCKVRTRSEPLPEAARPSLVTQGWSVALAGSIGEKTESFSLEDADLFLLLGWVWLPALGMEVSGQPSCSWERSVLRGPHGLNAFEPAWCTQQEIEVLEQVCDGWQRWVVVPSKKAAMRKS